MAAIFRNMIVFISYASEHRAIAERVALSLRGSGFKVFLDKDDLPAGVSYDERIQKAIARCGVFVFLVSPEALGEGRYTLTELKLARAKWPNPSGAILPVMIVPTGMGQLPEYLKAVTVLQPHGDVAAEVNAAIAQMTRTIRGVLIGGLLCLMLLAATVGYLLVKDHRGSIDLSVGLSGSAAAAAAPKESSLLNVSYHEVPEGRLSRISYRLAYLDLVHSGGPVPGITSSARPLPGKFPALAVKLVNNTGKSVVLSSAIVKIISSEIPTEPIPVFAARSMNALQIDNDGWGDVVDPVLEISVKAAGHDDEVDLFAPETRTIARKTFSACDTIRIAPFVPERLRNQDAVTVFGTLSYGPADQRKSLKYETTVLLDIKAGQALPPSYAYPPAYFEAGKAPCTIAIDIAQAIEAGRADQFLVTLGTDKTSHNRVSLSFKTTAGEILPGGDFLLDLYVPRRDNGRVPNTDGKP